MGEESLRLEYSLGDSGALRRCLAVGESWKFNEPILGDPKVIVGEGTCMFLDSTGRYSEPLKWGGSRPGDSLIS